MNLEYATGSASQLKTSQLKPNQFKPSLQQATMMVQVLWSKSCRLLLDRPWTRPGLCS